MSTAQALGPMQTQWVEALESGKYPQGKSKLRTIDNEFCCLGVACDLFGPKPEVVQTTIGNIYAYDGQYNYLPASLQEKLKFHTQDGKNIATNTHLTYLNDDGKTFVEIAQMVRANPSHFFREPV